MHSCSSLKESLFASTDEVPKARATLLLAFLILIQAFLLESDIRFLRNSLLDSW